ncbi:GerW family sporulation protein [Clostridium tepidiprofundi]|nr:GerW family sporulation protein [Clostridium tepidiprofundi]
MENHPIENLMKSTMENIKNMIDVDTIIGNPVVANDNTTILPVSKVSVGFASGGSEFSKDNKEKVDEKYPFGGGSGAGVTVKPVAFLVVKKDSVRLLPVDQTNTYDRLVDSIPQILDILKDFSKKKSSNS